MSKFVSRFARFFVFAALWFCGFGIATLQAANGQVEGWVDGVFGPVGAQYIQGWACEPNNPNPLTVHLYTGGAAGAGQIYNGYIANAAPNDPGVSAACGTTTGHRFFINVSGDLFARGGQSIYVHGIAQSGGPNNLLQGSGSHSIPYPTTVGNIDILNATGLAAGWAFDYLNTSDSINVAVYADGNALQGAETGTLVWEGPANGFRPDVNAAFGIGGNHGFNVQLPSWVVSGVHTLSIYPVNVAGGVGGLLSGSPKVPGSSTVTSNFSFNSTVTGFPSQWFGYSLPAGQQSLVSLSGTVSVNNSANTYSEMLFIFGDLPSGSCPTSGTTLEWGLPGTVTLWTDIIKTPTTGTFTTPVNFTVPVGVPISNCLVVGINGGTVSTAHSVTGTVNLVAGYTQGGAASAQVLGLDSEFCFGQTWGCQLATPNDSEAFASVLQITQRSHLNAIWGNISDSTFDGHSPFGPLPTGAWTANNDVYVYHGSECSQFPSGHTANGPGSYYSQIPADATHLLSAPLSGNGGAAPGATINYLLPGLTNGIAFYQDFANVTLNAGDCVVSLYGLQGTSGAFDNEDQLHAIVTPF